MVTAVRVGDAAERAIRLASAIQILEAERASLDTRPPWVLAVAGAVRDHGHVAQAHLDVLVKGGVPEALVADVAALFGVGPGSAPEDFDRMTFWLADEAEL